MQKQEKTVTDRIKTMQDVCEAIGIDHGQFMESIKDKPADVQGYEKCRLICQALNEGWQPDWSNSSEYKYYPWMKFVPGSGFSYSDYVYDFTVSSVGSRLCYKSSGLVRYAAEQFQEEYNQLFTF